MTDVDAINFFRDDEMVADPYPYYEALRSECPVRREPHENVVMVTGYEEATAVFNDTTTFSSCTSVTGPFPGFPVPLDELRRRRHLRPHRRAPRLAADERPAPDAGPADAHRPSRSADAADHAEAPQGERGVHVAVGRPPDRHVHRPGQLRVHQRLRQPVRDARHRRPPRRAGGGPRAVRGDAAPPPDRRRRRQHQHGRWPIRRSSTSTSEFTDLHRGSPRHHRATTC